MPEVSGIKPQWERFCQHIGQVPGQVGGTCYGVCHNMDSTGYMDYLCGVEVSDKAKVSPPLQTLEIPAGKYAVFSHREHISTIGKTWAAIFQDWLPSSGHRAVSAPQLEVYGPEFNPEGEGLVEIWIPVELP